MTSSRPSLPTIGLFVHDLVNQYTVDLLSGVADYVREQHANLICFTGGELDTLYNATFCTTLRAKIISMD